MTWQQAAVLLVLLAMFILFALGKPRYDVVALAGLGCVAVLGLVPGEEVFSGFGHGAVITVAAVLVVSRALTNSGVVDSLDSLVMRAGSNIVIQIALLTLLVAVCSAFINNVGALAIFLPISLRMSRKTGTSPSLLLMPLAFGSLLGGLATLIGTPPNIIIATFRAEYAAEQFRMFDFLPVGGAVALCGLVFLTLVGWRLLPVRRSAESGEEMFEPGDYVTELRVPEDSELSGIRVRDIEKAEGADIEVVGVVRAGQPFPSVHPGLEIMPNDSLVVRAEAEDIEELLKNTDLELVGQSDEHSELLVGSEEVTVAEVVVMPTSRLVGHSAASLSLRTRFGLSLLAVSRQGSRLKSRLSRVRFREGDVLLVQGDSDSMPSVLGELKCLPLASRGIKMARPRRLLLITAVFGGAVALTSLGMLPVQLSLTLAAVGMVLFGFTSAKEAYESIDWAVIVLFGSMIPVSGALERTGAAEMLATRLVGVAIHVDAWVMVSIVMLFTMVLSDLVNNAPAALLMAPIALRVAQALAVQFDPFLMAVAVGASCSFLTPIGHQSNMLVMGPGGYRFGDYWRVGLPLQIIVLVVATPMILAVWPL